MMFSGFLKILSGRKFVHAFACVGLLLVAGCDTPEEKVQNHYESAQELFKDGNLIKAGLEFRNALQINAKFVPALYGLALVEEQQGHLDRARGLLSRVLDLSPRHYGASLKFGKYMLLAGQLDKALELSDLVMTLDGTKAEALSFRAAVLLKLDDTKGAILAAKKALAADPANVGAIAVLAAERIAKEDFKGAIAFLDQSLKLNEKNVTLNLIKIQVLGSLKDTVHAEEILRKLIGYYPEKVGFKTALVQFYLNQKRVDDAEKIIRSIAKTAPEDLQANLNVVRFLNTFRGRDAAQKHLSLLVGKGDKNIFPYQLSLSRLLYVSGKKNEAKKILQDVIATSDKEETKLEAKNRLAEFMLADGETTEAEKLVVEILAADSQNADALMIRAAMQMTDKHFDEAVSDLRTVLKGQPDSVRALMMLGAAHEMNGAVELADDRMAGAFQASKFSPQVGLVYSRFLVKNGALGRAEDALIKVLIKSPRQIATLRALAQVRISKQDWLGAQEVADILTKLGDEKSVTSQIKGIALQGQEKIAESIKSFEQAQSATPDALRPMVALVRAYVRNGEADRAEKFIQAVLRTSEKNMFAKVLLAQLHSLNGKNDEAEAVFKNVISESPDKVVGYSAFASYYIRQNRIDEADAIVSAGLDKLPDNVTLGLLKAGLFERQKDYKGALAEYEALYKKRPNSEVIINNLASMLTEFGADDAAVKRAYEMAKRFKNSAIPHFKDTLGWIEYRMGNYEDASALLQAAADQVPNLAVFRYHLGMALKANQQPSTAIQELEKAIELSKEQPFAQEAEAQDALKELHLSAKPVAATQN